MGQVGLVLHYHSIPQLQAKDWRDSEEWLQEHQVKIILPTCMLKSYAMQNLKSFSKLWRKETRKIDGRGGRPGRVSKQWGRTFDILPFRRRNWNFCTCIFLSYVLNIFCKRREAQRSGRKVKTYAMRRSLSNAYEQTAGNRVCRATDVNIHGWGMPQLNCHQNPQLRFRKIGAHGALNCSGEREVLCNGKG